MFVGVRRSWGRVRLVVQIDDDGLLRRQAWFWLCRTERVQRTERVKKAEGDWGNLN